MLPIWMRGLRVESIPLDRYGRKQFEMGTASNFEYENVRDIADSALGEYGRILNTQCDEETDDRLNELLLENRPISYDDIDEIARQTAGDIRPTGRFDSWMAVVGLALYDEIVNYDSGFDSDISYAILFDHFYARAYNRMENASEFGFTDFTIEG